MSGGQHIIDAVTSPATTMLVPAEPNSPWWPHVRSILLGVALVLVFTRPTLTHPASVGRLDTGDGRLSIWNIGWIVHALTTNPRELLNANMFWPHQGVLMYSEPNLVAGLLGLPWFAATGSALAALNGAAATGLVLTFVLTAALVRRFVQSEAAANVSAIAFTFCPFIHARTAHIQLLMTFVFPLVLLAYHWMLEHPTVRRGLVLGGALTIAAYTCSYYAMYAGLALAVVALVCARWWQARYWIALAVALAVVVMALLPFAQAFMHYRELSGTPFVTRDPNEARSYAADLTSWLSSATVAHAWWLRWLPVGHWRDVLFPGIGLLALAGIGLAVGNSPMTSRPHARTMRRIRWTYLAVALLAFWASFGPDAGLYRVLQVLPGVSFLRVASRVGIVVSFALAILAGFGALWLERRSRWAPWVVGAMIAVELSVKSPTWGWPAWPLQEEPPVPAAFQRLATLPAGGVVEFPFPYVRQDFHNHTWAMFHSTYHWQPIVNGYTDLIPQDFQEIALPINAFPDDASFAIMKRHQVRYVVWRTDVYKGETRRVISERLERYKPYLRPMVLDERAWLYEITSFPEAQPSAEPPAR